MLQSQKQKLNKRYMCKFINGCYLGYYCNINTFISFVNLANSGNQRIDLNQHKFNVAIFFNL